MSASLHLVALDFPMLHDYALTSHVYAFRASIGLCAMHEKRRVVVARLTSGEKRAIIAAAEAADLSVSEYALRVMLARAEAILNPGAEQEHGGSPPTLGQSEP